MGFEITELPDIGSADGIMTALFQRILADNGVDNSRFDQAITRYIAKLEIDGNVKEAALAKGSLRKDLTKGSMSWKVFLKGMAFLGLKQFVFRVELKHKSKRISVHRIEVPVEKSSERSLSKLYKSILYDLNMNNEIFDSLLVKYIVRTRGSVASRNISEVRSSLRKEFLKDTMTWKVFMKGITFLQVWEMLVSVEIDHGDKTTIHSKRVLLDNPPKI